MRPTAAFCLLDLHVLLTTLLTSNFNLHLAVFFHNRPVYFIAKEAQGTTGVWVVTQVSNRSEKPQKEEFTTS